MYLYTADKENGIVSGFIVEYSSQVVVGIRGVVFWMVQN